MEVGTVNRLIPFSFPFSFSFFILPFSFSFSKCLPVCGGGNVGEGVTFTDRVSSGVDSQSTFKLKYNLHLVNTMYFDLYKLMTKL